MATIADMQAYNMLQKIGPMNEGLALGGEEEGGRSPYEPYKPAPTGPFVPPPGKKKDKELANLPDGQADPAMMYYPTENGFFLDGTGKAYMQTGGKLYDAGEYNIETHGLPVPLAQQMQINPDIARDFTYDAEPGGVATPRYFTPPEMRDYFRTPGIKEKELFHFNNFIRSLGPGLDTVQRSPPMSIG